tara:strand:- start:430 stop:1467 length:1038 start_codon:yes stop_codon:yes gene_type:complete
MASLIDKRNPLMDIVNSIARGAPQAVTGFVDLAALPFTLSGLLEPKNVVGSTEYLTARGLLPRPSQSLLGQSTEAISGGLIPITPSAVRAAQQGIESVTPAINRQYEQVRRQFANPVFNTEVAVTNPALLQNVDLNNPAGMALSRERLNVARQETGSQYANAPMASSQGAWQGSQGFEANPVFMQELPAGKGNVKDQDYMKYIAQTSENLTQDANAVARFVPFLLNDTIRSNAAIIKNVTPEQLKKLGESGLTNEMVIAARPGNKALVMGFNDEPGQVPQLLKKIKEIVPDVKFETGISKQDVDRIYMVRNPDEFGTPTYADFGATPRPSGLLDTLDERLRQESY